MLALYCGGLILLSLLKIGTFVLASTRAQPELADAIALFVAQGAVIACALMMFQNVKLGFLVFLALQGFEMFGVWSTGNPAADPQHLELLLPAGKGIVAGFFLFGGWNT